MTKALLLSSVWREHMPGELYLTELWKVGRGYIVEVENQDGEVLTGPLCVPASWTRSARVPGWRETCEAVAVAAASIHAHQIAQALGILNESEDEEP